MARNRSEPLSRNLYPDLGPDRLLVFYEVASGAEIWMKRKRYQEAQILFALLQSETDIAVMEKIRKLGITEVTFYRGKKKFVDLGMAEIRRLKQLEDENRRLKQLVADRTHDKQMIHEVLSTKL